VTGIEPALSALEAVPSGHVTWPDLRDRLSGSDREGPLFTGVNGPLMARRTAVRHALKVVPWPSPILLDSCHPSGRDNRAARRMRVGYAYFRQRPGCRTSLSLKAEGRQFDPAPEHGVTQQVMWVLTCGDTDGRLAASDISGDRLRP
jgi:hypothetical protein